MQGTKVDDGEVMAIYLAALYAAIAHDLEDDYRQAREQGSQQHGREVGISKSDLVRPLLEESIMIACSYLHAAATSPREAGAMTCRRHDVMEQCNEYMESLRLILRFAVDENDEFSTDIFQSSPQEHHTPTVSSEEEASCSASGTDVDGSDPSSQFRFTVPNELKSLVKKTSSLHRFLLPKQASLVVTTSEHLPPAFTLRVLATTLLEGVVAKAASERHRSRGHRLVVERAEETLGSKVDRELMRILEFYTNNRLKVFYSDCFYSRDKTTQVVHGKLRNGCECREVLHMAVSA